jgi:hypothetical protein
MSGLISIPASPRLESSRFLVTDEQDDVLQCMLLLLLRIISTSLVRRGEEGKLSHYRHVWEEAKRVAQGDANQRHLDYVVLELVPRGTWCGC